MPLPAKQHTWVISPCNRITYASLLQVQREFMWGVKEHLVANGYTVKGSCDGTTGAMDAVDRWAAPTDADTRGANVTTAVSWMCLTSANGTDILLSYVGASDDIYRISVSHEGDYVAAGTPTHTPTSGNEQVIVSTSTIDATASADRLWSCWARDDGTGFRVAIARSAAWVGQIWGSEGYSKAAYSVGVTTSDEIAFGVAASQLSSAGWAIGSTPAGASAKVYAARTSLSTNLALCSLGVETFSPGSGGAHAIDYGQAFAPELQGATEYYLKRVSIFSNTTGMRGKVGNVDDWWLGRSTGSSPGDVYGNREFICVNLVNGTLVWPWDGTPSVAGTAVVMS